MRDKQYYVNFTVTIECEGVITAKDADDVFDRIYDFDLDDINKMFLASSFDIDNRTLSIEEVEEWDD